ncbi:facilitated trehalose transporter Tret1-like [Pararge aegeria]|uniref:facilitated trehalose transporter Tret1-like n=1 Tax=Pararge aegeria TaxID=116150 RepID=UPI0019D07666|nr:facilitated trehalose transporter Tret1-like [Pararge aegeria]
MTFCCIFGIHLLALFGEKIGRRWSYILFSIPLFLNWVLVYYATGFVTLLTSKILGGISVGGIGILNLVAAAEFTSPNSRAFFLSMVSMVAPAVGTGLGHTLGVIVHWRTLALSGILLSIASLILPLMCVESPQWLASKGRFEDCEKAFRQLHGSKPSSEEELRLLISMERSKQKSSKNMIKKVLVAFKKKYFWGLIVTNFFIYTYYSAAGKAIFSNLATVMLEEMTGTSDVLLYTLLVDGFILIGTCASCVLIRKMSVRMLLFSSGFIANGVLITLSACLYFKNTEQYFQWINVTLFALYFIIVHAGPYPVMEILLGELFPLDIKLFCFFLTTPTFAATVCASIIVMPILVGLIGYHGLFLLNSVLVFVCLIYFWIRLPETKGKTLQEIEVYFKTNDFDVDKATCDDQIKSFI